jgi:hypothetical protein
MTTAAPLSLGFVWRVGREATRHGGVVEPFMWNPPCGTLRLCHLVDSGVTHIRFV